MSTPLVRTLIRTCLADSGGTWTQIAARHMRQASHVEWQQTVLTLLVHRLVPLVTYALGQHSLLDAVPAEHLAVMRVVAHKAKTTTMLNLLTLDGILTTMQQAGLHPVLWKGVVLADSFYPHPQTRAMDDIDFSLPPEEMSKAHDVFQSLGFIRQEQMATDDAVYYLNRLGVLCDVHHRVRLFEAFDTTSGASHPLTIDFNPTHLKTKPMNVLEPNAMLVHLVVHMDGHRDETGPLLIWMLDVAFVLRRWGGLIDLERIQTLMPAPEHLISLLRLVRFLHEELHEPLPESLAIAAQDYAPYTLAEILRQRRLAIWGLPTWRGWVRLLGCRLGITSRKNRVYPHIHDLLPWATAS